MIDKNMTVRLLFIVLVGFIFSVETHANTNWSNHALVVAKPLKVEFKKNLSSKSEVYAGEMFIVRLKTLEVIKGKLNKKVFTVDLFASHKKALQSKKKLYILIEKTGESLKGVSWTVERTVVCFPRGSIETEAVAGSFRVKDEYLKSNCIGIK